MQLIRKIQTYLLIILLLISPFTIILFNSDSVSSSGLFGEDLPDQDYYWLIEEIFGKVLTPHPYRFVASYYVNESLNVSGDIVFDLFFSSTILSQLGAKYKDKINVSLHYSRGYNETTEKIENANKTIKLNPELFGDFVQEYKKAIVFEDVNFKLESGDTLFVLIEIIQSEKPIAEFIEKRFDKKIKGPLEKIADLLNNSEDPEIQDVGILIEEVLLSLEESGIDTKDIADLANSIRSSAFYYGSKTYNSSLFMPIDSGENKTLYFQNYPDYENDVLGMGFIKTLNETNPISSSENAYPPLFISLNGLDFENTSATEEWMGWFFIWLFTVLDPTPPESEDIITYYLDKNKNLVLSEPKGTSPSKFKIKNSQSWKGISVNRNKIIKNASAELYIYFPKILYLFKPKIKVTLFDETANKDIATATKKLDHSGLIEILQGGPDYPTIFEFNIIEEEIWYNHNISLKISVSEGPIAPLRSTTLLCDSENYASSIILKLGETENIKIVDDEEDVYEKYVIPGGSAEFVFNVESKYEEKLNIEVNPQDKDDLDFWNIEYTKSVDILENSSALIHVYVNSTENNREAYYKSIDLFFNVSGLTGFDSKEAYVEVSDDAVDFDIDVVAPKNKEIKHGETGTYSIVVRNNNTGFWYDYYTVEVESEHEWELEFDSEIPEIDTYYDTKDEYILKINVTVPEFTEITTDKLTVIIHSNEADNHLIEENVTIILTTKVIAPNVFEHFYHFFELVGEDIGLDDVLGEYAGALLLFLVIFIILIFLVVIISLIKRKYIEVVCLDRIKEIKPEEEAHYNITIRNPSKKTLNYSINVIMDSEFEGWDVSVDKTQVEVRPKSEAPVMLIVKPTDNVKPDDWIETKVMVKIIGKEKSDEISTVTSIIDGKPDIKISGVFHWPRVFKKGKRIETSFRLRNNGNVSASNINVILSVNGKEKNKIENITIPRGGYAEVEIPWIAVKGKNKVDIVVK